MARNHYPYRVIIHCLASDPTVEAFARTRATAEQTASRIRRKVDANNPGENFIAVRVQVRSAHAWETLEDLDR